MTDKTTQITNNIRVTEKFNSDFVIADECYHDQLVLSPKEVTALRLYLEQNPQIGTDNLEPNHQLGTEAPTWNQTANLEPAENGGRESNYEKVVRSQNKTAEFRRALTLAVAPAVFSDPIEGSRTPATIAREIREIVDAIVQELEGN